jgi:hypothetical protein
MLSYLGKLESYLLLLFGKEEVVLTLELVAFHLPKKEVWKVEVLACLALTYSLQIRLLRVLRVKKIGMELQELQQSLEKAHGEGEA